MSSSTREALEGRLNSYRVKLLHLLDKIAQDDRGRLMLDGINVTINHTNRNSFFGELCILAIGGRLHIDKGRRELSFDEYISRLEGKVNKMPIPADKTLAVEDLIFSAKAMREISLQLDELGPAAEIGDKSMRFSKESRPKEKEPDINYEKFREGLKWLITGRDKLLNSRDDADDAINFLRGAFVNFKKGDDELELSSQKDKARELLGIPPGVLGDAMIGVQRVITELKKIQTERNNQKAPANTILEKLNNLITITGDASISLQIQKMQIELRIADPDKKFRQKLGDLILRTMVSIAKWFADAAVRMKAFARNTDGYAKKTMDDARANAQRKAKRAKMRLRLDSEDDSGIDSSI